MKAGAEILRCQPFSYVVLQRIQSTVCDGCFKKSTENIRFQRCSGCKYIYYCGPTCQRNCWPVHRDECKYLKEVFPRIPTDTTRLMARIVLKLQCGGLLETATLPDGSKRCFDDLISHQKNLIRDDGRMEAFESFFAVLQDCLGDNCLPPKSEMLEIYGKILVNSFNIMDEEYQPLGIGIYLAASIFDHSCDPSANIVFQGKELIANCIKENLNFCDMRISYTNLLNTTEERRKDLKAQYYFECSCEVCSDDQNEENLLKRGSILCQHCKTSIPTAEKPAKCPKCDFVIAETVYDCHAKLTFEVDQKIFLNVERHPEPLDQCAQFYPEMVDVFSPYDKRFVDIVEHLYEASISDQKWGKAFEFGQKLLTAYQRLYPRYDVNTALILMKLAKLACYLNRFAEAEKYLESAATIVIVTHGRRHSLFKETLDPLLKEIKLQLKAPQDHGMMMMDPTLEISKSG